MLTTWLALSATTTAPTLERKALRVVVRIADADDEQVLSRIHGQTSDLPVTIVAVPDLGARTTVADQVAAANALSSRERADAVVWFSYHRCSTDDARDRTIIAVNVAQPAMRSVLVRVVGEATCAPVANAAPSPEGPSASFEMLAIVVRSALIAISEGGAIGVAPARPEIATTSAARARLSTGWVLVLDGLAPRGHHGLAAAVGVGGARFGFELALSATLPAEIVDELTTVALSRTTVAAGGFAAWTLGTRLATSVALRAGAMVQSRTTTSRRPDVIASPNSRYASVIGSAEWRAAWSLTVPRGLAVFVGLAADYVPSLPTIVYTTEQQETVQPRRPWAIQPRIVAGLELVLP